ncbi:hypothetical protein HHK36_010946 [Tetracentron sinense]|uniref:Uncharacterized protein n=1 Tax=Tetracentron sinense TaxID=13715 RepID=A0A834ZBF4_TETSI|nr:hypothetical protein HHK36_010946 [Tetracentron sinense]
MDVSSQCANWVSDDVNCLHYSRQGTSTLGDSSVAELGNALSEVLHIQDIQDLVSSYIPSLDEHGLRNQGKDKMCGKLKTHQDKSLIATSLKSLSKCATFPCPTNNYTASMDGKDEIRGAAFYGQSSMESVNTACRPCTRSRSLPTPVKLVSAMKGGRENTGTSLKKLTVTWAPDVYDPPVTSVSHSVKSHNQQRLKNNKKNGKHKQKAKSSRGSSTYRKQHRKNVGSSDMRSRLAVTSDRLFVGGFSQSAVELVDFAVTSQDSKCWSSFLRTSLPKVHISVAEAT